MKYSKSKWIIAVISFAFFIIVWNKNQWFDSYAFVVDARNGIDIVHPHHLLYNLFRYMMYHLSEFLGIDPFRLLSGVSSVFGAASLVFVYSIIKKLSSGTLKPILGLLAVSGLFGFWFYSTSVEVNITSVFFLLLALNSLISGAPEFRRTAFTFLWLSIGVLFHQILGLAVILFFIYEAYRYESFTKPIKPAVISLLPALIIYSVVGFLHAETKSIAGLLKWFTTYAHYGEWGYLNSTNIPNAAWGIVKAVFGGSNLRIILFDNQVSAGGIIYLILVSLISIGAISLIVLAVRSFNNNRDSFSVFLISLIVVYSAFAFWWAPNDDGFWLYPLIIAVIFVVVNLSFTKIIKRLIIFVIVTLIVINLFHEIIPNSRNKNSYALSCSKIFTELNITENDLVLTNMFHLALAHNYYSGVHVRFGSIAFQERGAYEKMAGDLRKKIDDCLGKIIVFENEMKPEPHRRFLYGLISPEQYDLFYDQLRPDLIVRDSVLIYERFVKIYELNRDSKFEPNEAASSNQQGFLLTDDTNKD